MVPGPPARIVAKSSSIGPAAAAGGLRRGPTPTQSSMSTVIQGLAQPAATTVGGTLRALHAAQSRCPEALRLCRAWPQQPRLDPRSHRPRVQAGSGRLPRPQPSPHLSSASMRRPRWGTRSRQLLLLRQALPPAYVLFLRLPAPNSAFIWLSFSAPVFGLRVGEACGFVAARDAVASGPGIDQHGW